MILRTSRFFPELDDSRDMQDGYADLRSKANEFLFRRADIQDIVDAHVLALEKARRSRSGRYIVSATSPFHAMSSRSFGSIRRRLSASLSPPNA